jgi:superfamily II DNA/RNA helicase
LEKPQKSVFAVILAPTRELAFQIHEVMVALGRGMGKIFVSISFFLFYATLLSS